MTDQPFFTVITPVFNRSTIVGETIQSVLDQDYHDFEYLIIDDSSSDNTVEVVNTFAAKDKRIRLIALPENKGRCFARNTGLENAKGKWICYLDSDDWYYHNHLSTFRQLIESNESFKAFAVDQHINGALKKYKNKKLYADKIVLTLNNFIEDNPLTANQLCHISDAHTRWSNERIPISEDWLFHRNLVSRTTILKAAVVTNNLRDHSNRSMNTTAASDFVKFNMRAANKFILENKLPLSTKRKIEAYTYILCVNVLLNGKLKKEAFQLFKRSLAKPQTYTYTLFYKALVKFFI